MVPSFCIYVFFFVLYFIYCSFMSVGAARQEKKHYKISLEEDCNASYCSGPTQLELAQTQHKFNPS